MGSALRAIASRLAAEGCTTFFVATVAEGIALRDVIDLPELYVFDGVSEIEAPRAAEYDLVPVINTDAQLEAWRPYRSRPIAVHVDTGMNRLGFAAGRCAPGTVRSVRSGAADDAPRVRGRTGAPAQPDADSNASPKWRRDSPVWRRALRTRPASCSDRNTAATSVGRALRCMAQVRSTIR